MDQGMSRMDGRARVLQLRKMDDDLIQRDTLRIGHVSSPPAPQWWKPHRGKGSTKSIHRASATNYQNYL